MNSDHNDEQEKITLGYRKEAAQKLIELAEYYLDFKRWGFHQAYIYINAETPPYAIYDSEWCRIMFTSSGWDMYVGDVINIYYGRLHAPNDSNVMVWNGQQCYCWHDVNNVLNFLDGVSPQEAVDQLHVHGQRPRVMRQFEQSELGKSLSHQPEWLVKMHAVVWEYYGMHLFEVFDLRRPDLWEQYTHFIVEYYKSEKTKLPNLSDSNPANDKIC